MNDKVEKEGDFQITHEINPVSGNVETKVTGTMPGTFICEGCGKETSGYRWWIENKKGVCVACARKPLLSSEQRE